MRQIEPVKFVFLGQNSGESLVIELTADIKALKDEMINLVQKHGLRKRITKIEEYGDIVFIKK